MPGHRCDNFNSESDLKKEKERKQNINVFKKRKKKKNKMIHSLKKVQQENAWIEEQKVHRVKTAFNQRKNVLNPLRTTSTRRVRKKREENLP